MPIVSNCTVIFLPDFGQRAFSAATARATAARIALSSAFSDVTDSERMSTSIAPLAEIVLTEVPPLTMPTLKVVLGSVGTFSSEMLAIARPIA